MNTIQSLKLFSADLPEGTAIPVNLEVVCLWSILGLILTALFLALGFSFDIGQALMLGG